MAEPWVGFNTDIADERFPNPLLRDFLLHRGVAWRGVAHLDYCGVRKRSPGLTDTH